MATSPTDREVDRIGGAIRMLRWFFGVIGRPQTYLNLAYLLLAFPLGLAYFVIYAVGLSLGIGLSIILVGFLIIVFMFVFALALASLERRLTNKLLGTASAGRTTLSGDRWRDQTKSLLLDRQTWSSLIYLPVKFVLGLVSFVVIFTGVPTAVAMMMVPLYYDRPGLYVGIMTDRAPEIHEVIYLGWNYLLVGVEAAFTLGYWKINTFGEAIVVAVFGGLGLFVVLHVCNGLASLWSRYTYRSLDGSFDLIEAIFGNGFSE